MKITRAERIERSKYRRLRQQLRLLKSGKLSLPGQAGDSDSTARKALAKIRNDHPALPEPGKPFKNTAPRVAPVYRDQRRKTDRQTRTEGRARRFILSLREGYGRTKAHYLLAFRRTRRQATIPVNPPQFKLTPEEYRARLDKKSTAAEIRSLLERFGHAA